LAVQLDVGRTFSGFVGREASASVHFLGIPRALVGVSSSIEAKLKTASAISHTK
jgi:hypothetical protein